MKTTRRTITALVVALSLLASGCAHRTGMEKEEPYVKEDHSLLLMDIGARPIGAAVTIAGFVTFVALSPMTLAGGTAEDSWNKLVVEPADYTLKRHLGEP